MWNIHYNINEIPIKYFLKIKKASPWMIPWQKIESGYLGYKIWSVVTQSKLWTYTVDAGSSAGSLWSNCTTAPKKTSLEKKVSQRPLSTFQEEMTSALATMRVDYEQIKIKTIEDSSNPLLTKRRKKASSANPQSAAHWETRVCMHAQTEKTQVVKRKQ